MGGSFDQAIARSAVFLSAIFLSAGLAVMSRLVFSGRPRLRPASTIRFMFFDLLLHWLPLGGGFTTAVVPLLFRYLPNVSHQALVDLVLAKVANPRLSFWLSRSNSSWTKSPRLMVIIVDNILFLFKWQRLFQLFLYTLIIKITELTTLTICHPELLSS